MLDASLVEQLASKWGAEWAGLSVVVWAVEWVDGWAVEWVDDWALKLVVLSGSRLG